MCHAIQLLAVVRTSLIEKYGINEILKPFMDDIKKLENVCMHVHILACLYNYLTFNRIQVYPS